MTWGVDVEDYEDEEVEEQPNDHEHDEDNPVHQFLAAVQDEDVESIPVSTIEDIYKDVNDADALRNAVEQDTRSSACDVYERRLRQLEPDDSPTDDEDDESEASDASETEGGWGVDVDDEDDDEQEEDNTVDASTLDELEVESLADHDDTEDEEEDVSAPAATSETESVGDVDIGMLAPNAKTVQEAADQDYLWRILGWAEPGKGKTHFGYTMPEPICIIDTEGKAHNLASKFEDTKTYIWQPHNWDEARKSLDEAIEVLEAYFEKGHRGTIVVDSMSEMWEWSKQKYVSKVYNGKSLDEVQLSANIGSSGQSDWKIIKRYHNQRFRAVMLDTPFHLYWTAMQTDDFEKIIEEGDTNKPQKPVGERDNEYKVDQVLHITEGPDGAPVGNLKKNGLSKYNYKNLRYPTFDTHKDACERIRSAEDEGQDPMLNDVLEGTAVVVEGDPDRWNKSDD